jgi:branched-chain amino acid transport system ATP-binding protein
MLEVDHIDAYYGAVQVLKGVTFSVAAGEIVALMGRNGAGKTTTLKTILRLVPPSAGSVRIAGEDLAGLAAHEIAGRGVAYVPQGRRLFNGMTVEENLTMGLLVRNSGAQVRERVLDLLPILRDRLKQSAGTLSGGEQQMLAMARALCAEPRLILLDEPSEGLVPAIVERLNDTILGLKSQGVAVLIVEQRVKTALRVADRVLLMEQGAIQHESRAIDLIADPVPLERYIGVHR